MTFSLASAFTKPLIAIDIGSSSVKLAELDGSGRKLKQIGLEMLADGAVADGEVKDFEVVARAIVTVLKRMKINPKGRRASIALNGSGVMVKRALISMGPAQDLVEQAYYEASQLFPFDPEDLFLRYATIGPMTQDQRVPMALVGARRALVEQMLGLVHSVGLKTGVVDCGVLALANMFDFNFPQIPAMSILINAGANLTQIVIMSHGEFLYTRDIAVGGRDYTRRLMDELQIDYNQAESLKIQTSLGQTAPSDQVVSALNEINESIVHEVQNTLNFFFESEECPTELNRQGYIFLAGGSARVLSLDASLAASLEMPVQVINPFQRIDVKSAPVEFDYIMGMGAIFSISVGLGLRKFRDEQKLKVPTGGKPASRSGAA